jgi:hypothetical protein
MYLVIKSLEIYQTCPGFSRGGKGWGDKKYLDKIGTCQTVVLDFYLSYTGQGSEF